MQFHDSTGFIFAKLQCKCNTHAYNIFERVVSNSHYAALLSARFFAVAHEVHEVNKFWLQAKQNRVH